MLLSCHQNAGQNHDIKITNRSFENVEQFECLGMAVTNQSLIHKEPSVFLSAVQNLQGYNFACGSLWVQILVSDIKGGTQTNSV
jgi:hypothetical protein